MPKKKKTLNKLSDMGIGLTKVGVTTGVGAAVAGHAAAGTPAMGAMGGFGMIASGAGIATTIGVGGALLGDVKKLNKKKGKK